MPDFEFVGSAYAAQSIYQNDQELINWYVEIDPTKAENPAARAIKSLYPTPGLSLISTLPQVGPTRGLWVISGGSLLFTAVGMSVYKIDANWNYTFVGNLNTSSGFVSFSDNGTSLYICDGPYRYFYTWGTNTFGVANDGAFTTGDICSYIDGYIVFNFPNTQQWGCTNALSVVSNALNFAAADSTADNIIAVFADHREVKILKEKSSEVWVNAGLFPFPFQRVPGTNTQHGCVSKYSIARLGESVAWLSKDDRGQGVVVMFQGYKPLRISTHAVENDIAGGVMNDAIAFSYQDAGHEFYVLTFPTQDKTWVFDITTGEWHKRAWMDSNGKLHRIRANALAIFQGKIIVGDWQNSNLYQWSRTIYADNGSPIPRIRRAPHITEDFRRVFHSFLQIQFEPGVGLQTGNGKTPQAMLRWSDDGGKTWGNEHWTTVGAAGQFRNRAIWRRLGQARDRVYEVRITDPINAVVVSAELRAGSGTT